MSCDVGEVTYVTTHSPTLPSLYLRPNSFSKLSVTSPTSQLILQPFFRFSYVTGFSLTLPGEPPMIVSPVVSVISSDRDPYNSKHSFHITEPQSLKKIKFIWWNSQSQQLMSAECGGCFNTEAGAIKFFIFVKY